MTKIVSRKVEFKGWHMLETVVAQPRSLKHDGFAEPLSREVFHVGPVVLALLYQPETDQVLFNQQFRMGAFMAGDENPVLIECCAGLVSEGEDTEAAVRREAIEETGCEIIDLEFIGKAYPSPGCMNETFLLYCGRIAKAEAGHYGLEEEGEEIKTMLVSAEEAIQLLDSGKITNGGTVMCMHWFARNLDRLRQKWSVK